MNNDKAGMADRSLNEEEGGGSTTPFTYDVYLNSVPEDRQSDVESYLRDHWYVELVDIHSLPERIVKEVSYDVAISMKVGLSEFEVQEVEIIENRLVTLSDTTTTTGHTFPTLDEGKSQVQLRSNNVHAMAGDIFVGSRESCSVSCYISDLISYPVNVFLETTTVSETTGVNITDATTTTAGDAAAVEAMISTVHTAMRNTLYSLESTALTNDDGSSGNSFPASEDRIHTVRAETDSTHLVVVTSSGPMYGSVELEDSNGHSMVLLTFASENGSTHPIHMILPTPQAVEYTITITNSGWDPVNVAFA